MIKKITFGMIYSDQNPFESNRIQPPLLKFPLEFRAAPRLTENADATTRRRFLFLYTVAKELITPPHFGLVSAVSDLINSILGLRSLLIAFFSKCLLTRGRDIGMGYEEITLAWVKTTYEYTSKAITQCMSHIGSCPSS